MAGNKVTIALTADQQKQVRDATGKDIHELSFNATSAGHLTDQDLENVAGGVSQENAHQV
jgi:hypothetical protein